MFSICGSRVGHAEDCTPLGDLNFICGIKGPEDLAVLPGNRWLIASGEDIGSGLHLVDIGEKSSQRWIASSTKAISQIYRDCDEAPAPDKFKAHGISLRTLGSGKATLYVVNHGGREAIEVFEVDLQGQQPNLTWLGCVAMPAGLVGNSVASAPDGAIFVTVMLHPGTTLADLFDRRPTGAVYRWHPGDSGFTRMWGTELAGNNGIDLSPDGKTMYVAATGTQSVTAFSTTNPTTVLYRIQMPGFSPDNIHWTDGRLVVAGMKVDEPACGGAIRVVNGKVDGTNCPRGYVVATIDPKNMRVAVLARGPATPGYIGVATGLPVGNTLWLGSFVADRLAYRVMP